MAKKTFTIKFVLDPADYKRLSRDAILSDMTRMCSSDMLTIAQQIEDINNPPRRVETKVASKKGARQLGSLGH